MAKSRSGAEVLRLFQSLCLGLLLAGGLSGPAFATDLQLTLSPQNEDLRDRLRAASLVASELSRGSATNADLLAAARADYARLLSALYARAHYGPRISIRADGQEVSSLPAFDAPARIDTIEISVVTGPVFKFGQADIRPLARDTQLPDGFRIGAHANSGVIQDAASAAVDGWRNLGHAKASVADQRITANHADGTLAAELELAPGPHLRFGKVTTSGDSRVRPERIRAIAGLPQGQSFSPEALKKSADRLRRSGAFRSVALTELPGIGPDSTQEIDIAVVDEKRRRMGAGVELSSLEGLTLSGLWMHRNLLGGAERLRLEAEVGGLGGNSGGEDLSFSARFDRPATFRPDTGFYAELVFEDLDEPDYKEKHLLLEAGLSRQFSDRLNAEAGVQLLFSEFSDDLGSGKRDFLSFPISATWDGRDDILDARQGQFLDLHAMPLVGLGEPSTGVRLTADTRWYHGFGSDQQHVAALRLQARSVIGIDRADLPPSLLFFSGGGDTVRGQPYQSLGVDIGGDDQVGGRSFFGVSGELRIAAGRRIGVVGFADYGVIGEDSFGGDVQSHAGAGLGLRYETGLGPLRLDLALPVSGDTDEGLQIYIGIGQAF